jgi:hypothetical protein
MNLDAQLWIWKGVLWSVPVVAALLLLLANYKIDRTKEKIAAESGREQSPPAIIVSSSGTPVSAQNNSGNIAVNSPGSTQIINHRRVLDKKTTVETGKQADGTYALRLTINQTDGIWDPGTKCAIQIYFSGPFIEWDFAGGYRKGGAQMNVVTSHGNPEAAAKGIIDHTTETPPLNEPIVIEVRSTQPIQISKLLASPSAS